MVITKIPNPCWSLFFFIFVLTFYFIQIVSGEQPKDSVICLFTPTPFPSSMSISNSYYPPPLLLLFSEKRQQVLWEQTKHVSWGNGFSFCPVICMRRSFRLQSNSKTSVFSLIHCGIGCNSRWTYHSECKVRVRAPTGGPLHLGWGMFISCLV